MRDVVAILVFMAVVHPGQKSLSMIGVSVFSEHATK